MPCAEDEAANEAKRKEAEMEKDQQDKEEFEARLKARDDEKTRRIVEERIPKEDLEVGQMIVLLSRADCVIATEAQCRSRQAHGGGQRS